jgi:hypothetical protein
MCIFLFSYLSALSCFVSLTDMTLLLCFIVSWGSLVSIVSGYGLDDRAIEVRSPAGVKDFSSILCVQTGSGAHPASCRVCARGPFPGGKAQLGHDAGHSRPSSAKVVNEEPIPPLPPSTSMACSWTALLALLYFIKVCLHWWLFV